MCGICAILHETWPFSNKDIIRDHSRLPCRGPDKSHQTTIQISKGRYGLLSGHVLRFRGNHLVPQPASDGTGNQFLWNGEIFGGIQVAEDQCDTTLLLDMLGEDDSDENIINTMSTIKGPWSFIYWQSKTETLWFGRDVFGRRSLLWHIPKNKSDPFILTSVRIEPWLFQEVPSIGIYKIQFTDEQTSLPNYNITVIPWQGAVWPGTLDVVQNNGEFSDRLYTGNLSEYVTGSLKEGQCVKSHMPIICKSLPPADHSQPELGKDQTFDEYLKDLLSTDSYLRTLSRQLTNVLLEAVKERVTLQHIQSNTQGKDEDNTQNGVTSLTAQDTLPSASGSTSTYRDQIEGSIMTSNANVAILFSGGIDSTVLAALADHTYRDQTEGSILTSNANVAILFSGGIDSTVLAALADQCLPPDEEIDLLNVAFEMKQKENPTNKKKRLTDLPPEKKWDVPDRQTGYTALSELNPNRKWNFVEVNVTAEELQEARQSCIEYLLHPLQTVLDDSIGCALWFASRGLGVLGNGLDKGNEFISKAKVILCGMGADEQLVGYSRHRVRFKEEGWEGLLKEIQLEITRISVRNLGRDDRIITDHGKESRLPYLDENVVKFLSDIPVFQKADLTLPRGLGEKLLLRMSAYELGLHQTATLPKRAIQFGSRIAKMENSKEKASDKCDRLSNIKNVQT